MRKRQETSQAVRDQAIVWCQRLAHDRAQVAWSIRLTAAEIYATAETKLAWSAYGAILDRLGNNTPRTILWTRAAQLLQRATKILRLKEHFKTATKARKTTPKTSKSITKEIDSMAKKQTRRSISVSGATYIHAKALADARGVPLSQFVEELIRQFDVMSKQAASTVAKAIHTHVKKLAAPR